MSLLDLDALDGTPLKHEPYDYLVVPGFLKPDVLKAAVRDYPDIQTPRNYAPKQLSYGPAFDALLTEIQGPELAKRVGDKFGVHLSANAMTITVRAFCEASDGNIHTDHWSKMVTALIYFNDGVWPYEGGQLRILRSKSDMEDYAAEVPPLGGTLLAFRRSRKSFHGHKPHVGMRRMVQISWNNPHKVARYVQEMNRLSTHTMKRVLGLTQ